MGGIIGGALAVAGKAASAAYRGAQSFVGPRVGGNEQRGRISDAASGCTG